MHAWSTVSTCKLVVCTSLVIGRSLPFLLAGSPTQATGTGRDATRRDPNRTPGRPGRTWLVAAAARCCCCCMHDAIVRRRAVVRPGTVGGTYARTQLSPVSIPPPPSSPLLRRRPPLRHASRPVLRDAAPACMHGSAWARVQRTTTAVEVLACMHV